MHEIKPYLYSLMLLISLCYACSRVSARSTDTTQANQSVRYYISLLEKCLVESGPSFLWHPSYPATSEAEMATRCKNQTASIKCVKDKAKIAGVPAIIKRGINSHIQGWQKFTKKYCTNVNSDVSRKYVSDMRCIRSKKFNEISQLEAIMSNKAIEILRRNYNDSAAELKQICCTLFTFRQAMYKVLGSDCPDAKSTLDEYIEHLVSSEVEVLCGDEEKMLTKVCPNIENLNVSNKFDPEKDPNSAGIFLYLVATLGEPERG